eukprot:1160800-Pelagomonas_calceolata.AAC.3
MFIRGISSLCCVFVLIQHLSCKDDCSCHRPPSAKLTLYPSFPSFIICGTPPSCRIFTLIHHPASHSPGTPPPLHYSPKAFHHAFNSVQLCAHRATCAHQNLTSHPSGTHPPSLQQLIMLL